MLPNYELTEEFIHFFFTLICVICYWLAVIQVTITTLSTLLQNSAIRCVKQFVSFGKHACAAGSNGQHGNLISEGKVFNIVAIFLYMSNKMQSYTVYFIWKLLYL